MKNQDAVSDIDLQIEELAGAMPPITLAEMSSVRLMRRTDQKYVTNTATLIRLLEMVKDDYYSQIIGTQRISPYATTYWDTPDNYRYFRLHETGHKPRMKVRVREYVSSGDCFLEIKRKDNHGKTTKRRVQVPSVQAVISEGAGEDFLQQETGLSFSTLKPAVGNRFNRITLVNKGKTERLTIDFDIHFYNYFSQTRGQMDDAVIIELKRDGRAKSPILPILRTLRVKPSGFSKYCVGEVMTNSSLRVNRFKKRMIKIGKLVAKQPADANPHTADAP